jgi:hypothetical protein
MELTVEAVAKLCRTDAVRKALGRLPAANARTRNVGAQNNLDFGDACWEARMMR